jgi:hypothetical protein
MRSVIASLLMYAVGKDFNFVSVRYRATACVWPCAVRERERRTCPARKKRAAYVRTCFKLGHAEGQVVFVNVADLAQ